MPSSATGSASISKAGAVVGFDPWLHTAAAIEELTKSLEPKGIKLEALSRNPVDRIWGRERPAPPRGPIVLHPASYAGKPAEQKLAELQAALRKEGEDAVDPHAARLDRLAAQHPRLRRGAQSGSAGVCHRAGERQAGALHRSGQGQRRGQGAPRQARQDQRAGKTLADRLKALKGTAKRIRLDPNTAASWFFRKLKGGKARIVRGPDPCLLPKARKNADRDQGRARRPQARRRRRGALPRLARSRGAQRRARRDRGRPSSSRRCAARPRR